jgi:Flp pilus assembly protein TadD
LIPLTAGAYVTFLAHAAVDWDWELPAVTIAALLCGVAIIVAARRRQEQQRAPRVPLRWVAVAAAVAIAAFAFVGVVGNTAVSRARAAADRGDWSASAAQARKATHWLPWSADAWRLLGEAQLARGEPQAAASFRRAVAKDRNDWENWFDLALATKGAAHREALARARYLNPRDPIFKELHR